MGWLKKWLGKAQPAAQNEPTAADIAVPQPWRMPCAGEVIALSELPDPAFATGVMGPGFAIRSTQQRIVSPVNGTVSAVFPGGHAIGITADNGCELLIHIGIDSVNLKGEGFQLQVAAEQKVAVGTPLVEVDFALLASHLSESAVIVVFTNFDGGTISVDGDRPIWHKP